MGREPRNYFGYLYNDGKIRAYPDGTPPRRWRDSVKPIRYPVGCFYAGKHRNAKEAIKSFPPRIWAWLEDEGHEIMSKIHAR